MNSKESLAKEIYQEQEKLRNFILQRVDGPVAEEILQETLIAAVEAYPRFKQKSSLFTWLCAIAKHEITDYYRKKKIKTILFSRFPWLESLASQALGPEQILLRKEFEARVKRTMAYLNEGYQEVLRLKYYRGLSVKEIALKSNETVKAVESRLFRARKAFAQAFLTHSSQGELSSSG